MLLHNVVEVHFMLQGINVREKCGRSQFPRMEEGMRSYVVVFQELGFQVSG